jgi:L-ribulose-5-phosphate 3-epimerase
MKNLIEVFSNCYGPYGVRAAVEGVRKAGLSHVELALRAHSGNLEVPKTAVLDVDAKEEDVASFKALARDNNVSIITANGGADVGTAEGLALVKARLAFAKELGARYYVISGLERSKKHYDGLLELAEYALSLGIQLALETHPPLVTNAAEALKTMKDLQHRNIGINYDTANIYYYNRDIDTVRELEQLAEYVVHVHLKDSRKGFEDWFFPEIGGGTIDIAGIFRVLNGFGFYGPFSFEIEGVGGEGRLTLEQHQERVAKSAAYLREIGIDVW